MTDTPTERPTPLPSEPMPWYVIVILMIIALAVGFVIWEGYITIVVDFSK